MQLTKARQNPFFRLVTNYYTADNYQWLWNASSFQQAQERNLDTDTVRYPFVITDSSIFRSLYPVCLRKGALGWRIRSTLGTSKCKGRVGAVRIATRYGLHDQGIDPRWGARFSATVQTSPRGHPPSSTMSNDLFHWGKAAGAWSWPPKLSKDDVKERAEQYFYSHLDIYGLL
jgi:hypothetical protein